MISPATIVLLAVFIDLIGFGIVLPLLPLLCFLLLALALGLLALTLDDGNLWSSHKPPHNEKGRIAPALSSIAISAT